MFDCLKRWAIFLHQWLCPCRMFAVLDSMRFSAVLSTRANLLYTKHH